MFLIMNVWENVDKWDSQAFFIEKVSSWLSRLPKSLKQSRRFKKSQYLNLKQRVSLKFKGNKTQTWRRRNLKN